MAQRNLIACPPRTYGETTAAYEPERRPLRSPIHGGVRDIAATADEEQFVTQAPQKDSLATRRGVLAGVGLAGLAGAITACAASASSSPSAATEPATSSGAGAGSATTSAAASSSATPKTGGVAA